MNVTIEQLEALFYEHEKSIIEKVKLLLTKPKSIRINQNEAYEIYGRANVRAWRLSGQLVAYKMIRAVEYEVAALDRLMEQRQLIIKLKKK